MRILISLWMAGSSGRKLMLGILRYANEIGSWSVEIANNLTDTIPDLINRNFDGFIGEAPPEVLSQLNASDIPTVILAYPNDSSSPDKTHAAFMTDDDEQIGKIGADYILSLGNFASIAFVPSHEAHRWSQERQKGFVNGLIRHGKSDRLYRAPKGNIEEWLRDLPKPAAVMAAYDFRAKDVIDACLRAKIEIPRQVSVLGVDDDELICDYAQPTLSSIRIDHVDVGYCAAKALDKLIKQKGKPLRTVHIRHPADHIVERESTRPVPPTVFLANKIQEFIKTHARDPITVADVIRHVHVSRRLADLRLKEGAGKTVHEMLLDVRLNLVRNYLKKTQMPINKISRLSGFQNIQRLKYIFKARYGVSMRDFRTQHPERV